MGRQSGSGWTIAIGTTQAASNLTEYESDTYTEVGEVVSIGEFGDERNIIESLPLSAARVLKARGSANAGDVPVSYNFDVSDGGQDAIKSAFEVTSQSADEFNFRIQANDSGGTNPTTWYFRAKIASLRVQEVSADNIVTRMSTLAINTAVTQKDAA